MCEIKLFKKEIKNNEVLSSQCPIYHQFYNGVYFKKLSERNKFIFWAAKETLSTVVCPTQTKFYILQGTGIITLSSSCTLYTPTVILRSSAEETKNISTSVNIYPDLSLLNISELTLRIDKIKNSNINLKKINYKIPELINLHQSSRKLDDIINDIDTELENITTEQYQNIHAYGLYLVGGIMGYLIIHWMITKLKLYCRGEQETRVILRTKNRLVQKENLV